MIEPNYDDKLDRPTGLDLFCGAGGMSVGFLMAGGTPVGGVDFDKDSISTYKKLFPMAKDVYHGDIKEWTPSKNLKNVDVIIGGPPCQGFSLARGLRFVEDPRNHLYKHFVRALKDLQPKWFVMENVQGILNIGKGVIREQILEDFEKVGYKVTYKVINMAEYGVPQLRKRAIFVGSLEHKDFVWPEPMFKKAKGKISDSQQHLPNYISVNDALGDLNLPMGNYFSHRANSQMRGPRNRCAFTEPAFTLRARGDEFGLCENPATSAFVPGPTPENEISYLKIQNDIQTFFRHTPPSWVEQTQKIKQLKSKPIKLNKTRKLTIKEMARLQSFPDWVEFEGSKYSQAKQVGNAVPPLFAYHLFKQIFNYSKIVLH